jgi:hypothetical protein
MPKRSKRLAKGIVSIGRQIELHEKKLQEAEKEGDAGLVKYYEKEIEGLKKAISRKAAAIEK